VKKSALCVLHFEEIVECGFWFPVGECGSLLHITLDGINNVTKERCIVSWSEIRKKQKRRQRLQWEGIVCEVRLKKRPTTIDAFHPVHAIPWSN
jgi:hypothetical protein